MSITPERSVFENVNVLYAAAFMAVFFIFGGAATAFAAVRTSTATGGLWSAGSTWVGGVVPANADSAIIATTLGNSVTIGAAVTNTGVTVNADALLNFSGAYILTENGNVVVNGSVTGSTGTIRMNTNGRSLSGNGAIDTIVLASQNFSFLSGSNLTINNNINSAGRTVTNNGAVTLNGNYTRTGGTAIWTQGTNSLLNISGIFTPSANVTLNANASGNTISYRGAAQAVEPAAYANVVFDGGSGAKTIVTGTSISGNLSIAPSGSAIASIGVGLNISVGTLTLGGLGRINGTWGSTSSTATYKNNTYFALTTGRLTVSTDTRVTPTITVTNSPVIYTGSGQAAVVSGSVPGTASNLLTGGAASQINAGTYTVTADFVPTDTTSYTSLTGASAGNFIINPADQTITFAALPDKPVTSPDFTVSATASSGLAVVFSSLTTGVCTVMAATVHLVSVGTCTLQASQTGDSNYRAATPADQSFTVTTGPVAVFTLTNPGDMYAKTRLGYTVTRLDAYGNAVGTATTTVYLYSSSISGAAKFYTDSLGGSVITSVDIGPGHSTANVWYYDETPGTYTITASDATPTADGPTGITDATDSVIVMPVATKFVILPPASGTVDAPITVTVEAQEPDDSIDTNYQNNVTLNASGSATGGGVVDIVNGIGHLDVSDTHAETVTLSLSDSQSTNLDVSSTQPLTFDGGAIAQFTLNHPAASLAGQRAAYTVMREDQYGNATSVATTTVYLYSSSTSGIAKFYDAATNGVAITSIDIPAGQSTVNVWYCDEKVGNWDITASDHSSSPDGNTGINDAIDTHQVVAGPVASFVLNDPGDMTAGTRLGYTVIRKDVFNNLVTSGATLVYLSSDSIGTSTPVFYDAATGGNVMTAVTIPDSQSSAPFWYEDPNPGSWTVTASDSSPADGTNGVIDAIDPVTVSAAPIVATRFVIMPPANGTVDAPVIVTVKAMDASGNVDTTYQHDVTLNKDGSAVGVVAIVDGVGTLPVTSTVAHTAILLLTDSQATGLDTSSRQSLVFAPGAVAQFALTNPGDVAAGMRIGYTVSRSDQYGNAVTAGATTVSLSSTSTGVDSKFYDAASGGSAINSIVIPDGASSVGFWYYDEKAGDWFVAASAAGVSGASDPITVQPAGIAKFTLNEPGNMTAGTRLGYVVTRKDQFDNLVTAGVSLVYLYSSSAATTTVFYSTDTGGAPTTFATINDGSSTGSFWYYDETPGTWLVTASDSSGAPNGSAGITDAIDSVTVSAMPIVATRFVILPAGPVLVGTPAIVTVQAQDNAGNVDTTIQSGVMLSATGAATGAGLVTMVNGVGTLVLSDATAETVTLSLSDTEHTGLNVSSTRPLTFSAIPVVPPTGGSGAGGAIGVRTPTVTGVRISGRAFPGARVTILAMSPRRASITAAATASASGAFSTLLTGVATGAGSYGLVAADASGRVSQTKVLAANYPGSSAFLSLDASLLSPTMGLVYPTVRKGDSVGFIGSAVPGYTVSAQVDRAAAGTVTAAADGSYKILFPTAALAFGSHTVRVRQTAPSGVRSEYAPQKVFTVSPLFTPQTDFNQDGVINIQDWSVFLARWSSPIPSIRLLDDLNGDGKVDVTDLSIFVRTLKK